MRKRWLAIIVAMSIMSTTACGATTTSDAVTESAVETEVVSKMETESVMESESEEEVIPEETTEEFDATIPDEFMDFRKFIGKDISLLGIELGEEQTGIVHDYLESQFLGHKGSVSVQYDMQDYIIWSFTIVIEDNPLTEEEYEEVCSKVSEIFGDEIEERMMSYEYTGKTDYRFQLPKVDKLQGCVIGWNSDKCHEFFDNRHKKENGEIDETEESLKENLCTNGNDHSWKGNMQTGAIICTVCSEELSSVDIKVKNGENLTSVEKAKIYHTLDYYLTAMDSKGKYLYSVDEAYSKTEDEFGVTKSYLDDYIWNGHAYDDHVQYYVNKTNTGSGTASESWVEVTNEDDRNICWYLSCETVKNNLKSPSSAKFPFSYNSADVSIMKSGNNYKVVSIVDADNSFGAKIRSNTIVYIEKSGGNFTVISCTIQ